MTPLTKSCIAALYSISAGKENVKCHPFCCKNYSSAYGAYCVIFVRSERDWLVSLLDAGMKDTKSHKLDCQ